MHLLTPIFLIVEALDFLFSFFRGFLMFLFFLMLFT